VNVVSEEPGKDDHELRWLCSELATQQRDIHDRDDPEHRQDTLIARLRDEAAVRKADLALLRERLETHRLLSRHAAVHGLRGAVEDRLGQAESTGAARRPTAMSAGIPAN
jgi:hypothetical protein